MPWPDRTLEEWKSEIDQDMQLIKLQAIEALRKDTDNPALHWAVSVKESRRLTSDLYRMAEVAGISREEIDSEGPL